MKKFLIKILVYMAVVAIITLTINRIYEKKSISNNKFDYVPQGIEICNLGSSHGVHSLNYTDLENDYVCFNFALNSQYLSYDSRILEYYRDHLAPGGVVIIVISYFTPWGYPEYTEEAFESKNKRYYDILPPHLIKNYDLYTDIMENRVPALNDGIINVINTVFSTPDEQKEIPKSYPETYAVVDLNGLDEAVKAACNRHIFQNRRNEEGELFLNDEEIRALYDIVDICREAKATPILVTVPYLTEYTDELKKEDPDFYEQFYDWISNVSDQLNIEYFDYSLDERFANDHTLYFNADHLNSVGARKFTYILYDEVIKDRLSVSR